MAILAIIPASISGLGVAVALLSLIMAGVAAAFKALRYALFTALITTVNLFCLSVLTISQQHFADEALFFSDILGCYLR